MLNPNFTLRPLVVGNNAIERVSTYKILGIVIESDLTADLKWNSHVDYISKKASKKLDSLRILRRSGVDQGSRQHVKGLYKLYYICSRVRRACVAIDLSRLSVW